MITTKNTGYTPYQIAASNAASASLQAHNHSTIAQGPSTEEGNIYSLRAITLAGAAEGQSKLDSRSATYRGMLLHEAAMKAHNMAMNYHTNSAPIWGLSPAAIAIGKHNDAYKAHYNAAKEAARQLGMGPEHYSAYKGLKQAIRENPTHADNRLILADLLEEHGLEKEANRLRADPTGLMGRAVIAYRRARNRGMEPEENYELIDTSHRNSIGASLNAHKRNTKEAHVKAAKRNEAAANIADDEAANEQRYVDEDPAFGRRYHNELVRRWSAMGAAHRQLEQHHLQQADQLP